MGVQDKSPHDLLSDKVRSEGEGRGPSSVLVQQNCGRKQVVGCYTYLEARRGSALFAQSPTSQSILLILGGIQLRSLQRTSSWVPLNGDLGRVQVLEEKRGQKGASLVV